MDCQPTQGPARAEPLTGAVQVKAVDCNFALPAEQVFDGCPFSDVPEWLKTALVDERVMAHNRGHTDYASWDVRTLNDGVKSAGPGDWIVFHQRTGLDVCPYDIAKTVRAAR